MKNLILYTSLSALLISCTENENLNTSPEVQARLSKSFSNDNNLIIANAQELMDITGNVLSDVSIVAHGRASTKATASACEPVIDHFYLTDYSHPDTLLYVGEFTVDYGNGTSCNSSVVRKGKVIDKFMYILNTKNEIYYSRERITFENYEKDSHKIEGDFLIESTSKDPVTMSTQNATISYADGSFLRVKGALIFATNTPTETNYHLSKTISGNLEGRTRDIRSFTTSITTPIEYRYDCSGIAIPVPVKGTMVMSVMNTPTTTIEFGNGNCDRDYSVTSNRMVNIYEF